MTAVDNGRVEDVIIANLIKDGKYAVKVMPYLKSCYFEFRPEIIDIINKFWATYDAFPSKEELCIELKNKVKNDKRSSELINYVNELDYNNHYNEEWLLKTTEDFCRCRSYSIAILDAVDKLGNENAADTINSSLQDIIDATKISFDSSIGLDYFNDVDRRYEMYHKVEDKVSWGIREMDEISRGGMSKKNLICMIAGTGVGKSIFMCAVAANCIRNGQNVLYISMEMSEERVAERIDANLYNTPVDSMSSLSKEAYYAKAEALKTKSWGTLYIREFPTSCAGASHFKTLISDLQSKKNFVPDIVIVDYLNICCSSRVDMKKVSSSYTVIKAISEELRGLAVEQNCVVLTATQVNRQGSVSTDIDMADVSESFGITFVLDMMFSLVRTPDLDEQNMIQIKQLKNRYSDPGKKPIFRLGFDRDRMRVYDLDGVKDPFAPSNYSSSYNGFKNNSNPVTSKRNDFSNFNFGG